MDPRLQRTLDDHDFVRHEPENDRITGLLLAIAGPALERLRPGIALDPIS